MGCFYALPSNNPLISVKKISEAALNRNRFILFGFFALFLGLLILASGEAQKQRNKMDEANEEELTEVSKKEKEEIVVRPPIQDAPPQPKVSGQSGKSGNAKVRSSTDPGAKYPNLDDSFVPFDKEGNRYITQINQIGPHFVYHGDVLIGKSEDLDELLKNKVIKQAKPTKWTGGVIPYVIDEGLANEEQVLDAIEYLNLQTNIRIIPRQNEEENYVRVTLGRQDCYAYAGMIGGMQEIFLTPRCGIREILHEFMHTIGFFHEQTREDRDRYVKINWENIDDAHKPQFKKIPDDFLGVYGRPFDFESIMMYHSFTFAMTPDEPSLTTADDEIISPSTNLLSEEDIFRVNMAYPQ